MGERLTSNFSRNFSKTFFIDVFLVLCKLYVSFSAVSFECSAFHLDLPVAEQTKEKISDSNPPMMLHPTARFHWSLLYPNHVKEGPLKDSILFHTLSQSQLLFSHTARSQTDTGNCSTINFSHREIHPHYGAPAGKRLTALSLHLLVLCLFALIDSSVNGFNLDVSIRAN